MVYWSTGFCLIPSPEVRIDLVSCKCFFTRALSVVHMKGAREEAFHKIDNEMQLTREGRGTFITILTRA